MEILRSAALGLMANGLIALGSLPASGAELALPSFDPLPFAASLGSGSASFSSKDGVASISADVASMGDYAENWKFKAAVFDLRLPEALALPPESSNVSLRVDCPYERNPKSSAMLRVIIRDSRGLEWAVATRLKGGGSKIPFTKKFELIESYAWDVNELGRIDPWVMMPIDPSKCDEYVQPKAPISVVGFRLAVSEGSHFQLALKSLASETRGLLPDPYWCVSPDPTCYAGATSGRDDMMRYGWGPSEAGANLCAADLGLPKGLNIYSWEILSSDESKTLRSGSGELLVDGPSSSLELPLLPAGSYRLRLFTRGPNDKEGRDRYLLFLIIRNSRAEAVAAEAGQKPLSLELPGGNIVAPGSSSSAILKSSAPGLLKWQVDSPDRRRLLSGEKQLAANEQLPIELGELLSKEGSLWISASLYDGAKERDSILRMAGVKRPLPEPGKALGGPASKLDPLKDVFRRTKGDWHEGWTPIVSRHEETMARMKVWLDEAKAIGYNIVELSAPWYDLEPLPGVYQFEYLDKLIAEAEARGLYVVIRSHPNVGHVPGWVPRELQEDQSHRAHGIWHGGSNLIYSPASKALRSNYFKFLETLSARYRGDSKVLGYTLANVFFDHSMIDAPWLGQSVDCSEAMRLAYVDFLKAKYGSLAKLSKAHACDYGSWEDVAIPSFSASFDAEGRVRPPLSANDLDYADCKRDVQLSFRTGAMGALRKGDPACIVGPYSDQARAFLEQTFSKNAYFVAQGSMEDQFPPEPLGYIVRYEPHAKVTKGALVTDVGVSNLAFRKLSWNEFFNYWFPEWTLANVSPEVKAAELRLKAWFPAMDVLRGATAIQNASDQEAKHPAVIASLETMLYSWKHVHTSRVIDYVNLFMTRAAAERLRCDLVYSPAISAESLKGRPYVYLPYSSDVLDANLAKILEDYVNNGGRLIMEWSSGYWLPGSDARNVFGSAFGLPDTKPIDASGLGDSVAAQPEKGGVFDGVKLAFRLREYKPPIEGQAAPWIHSDARAYFRLCELKGPLPEGGKILASCKGLPVAYSVKRGQGELLFFAGTVDWLACPGLASRSDAWGKGLAAASEAPADPEVLISSYAKGSERFAIGRRFIHHSLIAQLKGGLLPEECKEAAEMPLPFAVEPGVKYSVKELLSGRSLGVFSGADIVKGAVSLKLVRGEAFVLHASPAN